MSKPRLIAFYLPQYHPTKHNDEWWGKGFTEWTNVGKAKPLFFGHQQPKVPADLGYYDLRLPEVRAAQAEMARDAGIEGFCYYHYWFGVGHEELDMPFKEVVRLKEPDFPFCLCWANESWHKKFWNSNGLSAKEIIAEQKYDDMEGNKVHFYNLLDAFKDSRYIKVDGRLVFAIYKPLHFQDFESFKQQWNSLAQKEGLKGFFFIGQTYDEPDINTILAKGFDAVNIIRLWDCFGKNRVEKWIMRQVRRVFRMPRIVSYKKVLGKLIGTRELENNVIPTIIPNWDHTPRSGIGGTVITGSTPLLFSKHVKKVFEVVKRKRHEECLVFLKSWNEWGEGNYMEPDLLWGHQYLEALKHVEYKQEFNDECNE